MDQPNYYAVIPANVRYDKNLSSSEKLFFAEVTALAQKEGYCWASRKYFADLFEVSESTVSTWTSSLKNRGHIVVEYEKEGNQIIRRLIYPVRKIELPPLEKSNHPPKKNLTDNNTSNNNTSNNSEDYGFNDFWEDYSKKKGKKRARSAWRKLTEKDKKNIKEFIPIYHQHQSEEKYRKYPESFINSEIWKEDWDEYKEESESIDMRYFT